MLICGLNQLGLCEDPGLTNASEIPWDNGEPPRRVIAGHGTSFIISKYGNVYSFGQNKFGVLGHGEKDLPLRAPRQILSLNRRKILSIATGPIVSYVENYFLLIICKRLIIYIYILNFKITF